MSMNTNYVDARTPEEIANAPKGVITYASSMNKDTLKESKAIYLDSEYILVNRTFDEWKAEIIQQAKEEERQKILAFINSGYKSPASDTGWSIYLDDVEDFINQLSNTK